MGFVYTDIGWWSSKNGRRFVCLPTSIIRHDVDHRHFYHSVVVFTLVSLGLLWPPQLRRYLFRLPTIFSRNQSPRSEGARTQLTEVQNEVIQMKYMAYERSLKLETEMKEIKELLRMAIQD